MTASSKDYIIKHWARSVAWFNTSPCHGEDRQFKSGRARLVKVIAISLLALGLVFAVEPKLQYQLDFKARDVGSALINGNTREIYNLFVPEFRREHPFAQFDSAVKAWLKERRILSVNNKVVDITGLGGHVSTYIYFQGEDDYNYLYQSWLYTDSGWQLVWISKILNHSFEYGSSDTLALRAIAKLGLRYFVSRDGLQWIRAKRVNLPETLVVVAGGGLGGEPWSDDGHFFTWRKKDEFEKDPQPPRAHFYIEVAVVRLFGPIGMVALDLKPWSSAGKRVLPRPRGTEIYLKKTKDGWLLHSLGKRW